MLDKSSPYVRYNFVQIFNITMAHFTTFTVTAGPICRLTRQVHGSATTNTAGHVWSEISSRSSSRDVNLHFNAIAQSFIVSQDHEYWHVCMVVHTRRQYIVRYRVLGIRLHGCAAPMPDPQSPRSPLDQSCHRQHLHDFTCIQYM